MPDLPPGMVVGPLMQRNVRVTAAWLNTLKRRGVGGARTGLRRRRNRHASLRLSLGSVPARSAAVERCRRAFQQPYFVAKDLLGSRMNKSGATETGGTGVERVGPAPHRRNGRSPSAATRPGDERGPATETRRLRRCRCPAHGRRVASRSSGSPALGPGAAVAAGPLGVTRPQRRRSRRRLEHLVELIDGARAFVPLSPASRRHQSGRPGRRRSGVSPLLLAPLQRVRGGGLLRDRCRI